MAEPAAPLHVLIIGAGVVGLTLAQGLKKQGIAFSIFERDSHATARGQGWGITIYWGLRYFDECLPEHVRERLPGVQVDPEQAKVDVGNFLFLNLKTGEITSNTMVKKRMRLKRETLRNLLMEDLPVQWDKKMVRFETTAHGVTAYFEDGTTASGTVLIGVEGGNSPTREALCPATFQLQPIAIRGTGVATRLTPEQIAPLLAYDPLLFHGMHPETENFLWFSLIDTPTTNLTGGNYYTVQFVMSWRFRDPTGGDDVPPTDFERVAGMKRRASNFAEPFKAAIFSIPDDTPVTEIKLGDWPCLEWDNHEGRVTLAGDAAHVMAMYRGEGANHGIMDAAKFVTALNSFRAGTATLKEAVDGYEAELRGRTAPAVLMSRQACLDAHDWKRVESGDSLLLASRSF